MDAFKLIFLCVFAAFACVCIRIHRPEMAAALALAAGAAVVLLNLDGLKSAAEALRRLADYAQMHDDGTLLRACGFTLLAEFAAQICEDAGEKALSRHVELCARLALMALALPLIEKIFAMVREVLM